MNDSSHVVNVSRLSRWRARWRGSLLLVLGGFGGVALLLFSQSAADFTSTDKFCDQACHLHPQATQSWIKSSHFTTKSGVVTHCVECHLPAGGIPYYTEKARLGARDAYAKYFKDVSKIDWRGKRNLEQAVTFTFDSACVKCHANLFSVGLSKKGVDGHLHYQRFQNKIRCINCHLSVGHNRGKKVEENRDSGEIAGIEDLAAFPLQVNGFRSYAEALPGSAVTFEMVAIPGGTFSLGSPESEPYRQADEGPVRTVRLNPFWMGRTEVSWREYEVYCAQRGTRARADLTGVRADAVTGPTPPYGSPDQGWGKGSRPAITMTHYAALKYCEWLSAATGRKYRLPTEAEWEYACRAGSRQPYFFAGDPAKFTARSWMNQILGVQTSPMTEYVKYQQNSAGKTHPPASAKPNPWGLFHMLGNVREFCLDWYDPQAYARYPQGEVLVNPRGPATGKEHVVRGGSFRSDAADSRAAGRNHTRHAAWLLTDPQSPKSMWWYSDCNDVGFRVVREFEGVGIPGQAKELTSLRR